MHLHAVVISGILRPDGALELDEKPALAPGRVQVVLRRKPHRANSMKEGLVDLV